MDIPLKRTRAKRKPKKHRAVSFEPAVINLMGKHRKVDWPEVMRQAVYDALRTLGEDVDGALSTNLKAEDVKERLSLLLKLEDICEMTGLSERTIQRQVKSGLFPSPRKIGARAIAWLPEDIESWFKLLPRSTEVNTK